MGGRGGLGVLSLVPGLVRSLSLVNDAVDATLTLLTVDMPRTTARARWCSSSVCSGSGRCNWRVSRDSLLANAGGSDLINAASRRGE